MQSFNITRNYHLMCACVVLKCSFNGNVMHSRMYRIMRNSAIVDMCRGSEHNVHFASADFFFGNQLHRADYEGCFHICEYHKVLYNSYKNKQTGDFQHLPALQVL